MDIIQDFKYGVHEIENCWIELTDGVRLAARLWIPESALPSAAAPVPVPAILEYVPYRKNDATSIGDRTRHYYLAGHGYATIRVDIRGSGESEGLLADEYHRQELLDCVEIISWLTDQPWCDGQVSMMGISWGGFNSLQVAAMQPAALKTIVTLCSTDDRYADDVHYIGGSVLAGEMLPWGTTMLAFNSLPPDPYYVGDSWRAQWLQRLQANPHFTELWLEHQHRDDYWRHGSVCEDYAAITCPVFMAGGWSDGYTDAILRLLQGLSVPRQAIVGPWSHNWPNEGTPGPAIGFLQEIVRWFDYWLKGIDNGIMSEPMLKLWQQEWCQPADFYGLRPGQWKGVPAWPCADSRPGIYYLNSQGLLSEAALEAASEAGQSQQLMLPAAATHGQDAGVWCPFGAEGDFPGDQKAEDGRCLVFDTPPLNDALDLIGQPEVNLKVSSDRPVAQLIVRLCDVADDGSSLLLSRGVLNLTHRISHARPEAMQADSWENVTIRLNAMAARLTPGHRIRLSLATSYWPMVWPAPEEGHVCLASGADSMLILPLLSGESLGEDCINLTPESAPRPEYQVLARPTMSRQVHTDSISSEITQLNLSQGPHLKFSNGLESLAQTEDQYTINDKHPECPVVRCKRRHEMRRGSWHIAIDASSEMRCSNNEFTISTSLSALEGEEEIFKREYHCHIPRNLV